MSYNTDSSDLIKPSYLKCVKKKSCHQVFIQGMINLNRSVDGDIVAIEMLPEEKWSCPSSLVLVDREEQQTEEDDIDDSVRREEILF